ncbi:hypothetical protein KBY93_13715 [Synechococcus sp. J7-Johnson]|nr:hypothetical protein [Synechococcus sp. J7-Johnson]
MCSAIIIPSYQIYSLTVVHGQQQVITPIHALDLLGVRRPVEQAMAPLAINERRGVALMTVLAR